MTNTPAPCPLTDEEVAILRSYTRSASAPWWKRAFWGRDVFHPRLKVWRILTAMQLATAVALVGVPVPFVWWGLLVNGALCLCAIVVRRRALPRPSARGLFCPVCKKRGDCDAGLHS